MADDDTRVSGLEALSLMRPASIVPPSGPRGDHAPPTLRLPHAVLETLGDTDSEPVPDTVRSHPVFESPAADPSSASGWLSEGAWDPEPPL